MACEGCTQCADHLHARPLPPDLTLNAATWLQVSALSDMLVLGRFDPKRPVVFRDVSAVQMLLDPGR